MRESEIESNFPHPDFPKSQFSAKYLTVTADNTKIKLLIDT